MTELTPVQITNTEVMKGEPNYRNNQKLLLNGPWPMQKLHRCLIMAVSTTSLTPPLSNVSRDDY